jgi:hypothetical protein
MNTFTAFLMTLKEFYPIKIIGGFIVTLSIGSIIKYITTKLSHLSSDGLKKWILAYFSDNAIENIISKLTNFPTFISWLQPIIKGTEIIFDILKQSLDKIKR